MKLKRKIRRVNEKNGVITEDIKEKGIMNKDTLKTTEKKRIRKGKAEVLEGGT